MADTFRLPTRIILAIMATRIILDILRTWRLTVGVVVGVFGKEREPSTRQEVVLEQYEVGEDPS